MEAHIVACQWTVFSPDELAFASVITVGIMAIVHP